MPLEFPTTYELTHVVRNRVVNTAAFIGATFCPIVNVYSHTIDYDVLESGFGMTKPHMIGKAPQPVEMPKMTTKRQGTAYWKETFRLNEAELLYLRQAGSLNERAGRMRATEVMLQMDNRLETRLEWLRWQTLVNGGIQIDEDGVKYNVVYNLPDLKDVSGGQDAWTSATSDPIAQIGDWLLAFRGTGAKGRTLYMNQFTANLFVKNKTVRDLLKQSNFVGQLSLGRVPEAIKLLIPGIEVVIYDEGYLDENKDFQLFIPDGYLVLLGQSSFENEKIMDFATTISLHNGGIDNPQPGKFAIVEDKSVLEKNPHVDITTGIYGLPRVFHPNWILRAKVA